MSRRSMPYHRRYHQDALHGYVDLSLEERGAYTTILDLIYDAGGPITSDVKRLCLYLQTPPAKVKKLLASLIEKGKIYTTIDGKISNRRAERELNFTQEISKKRAEIATEKNRKEREARQKTNENKGQRVQLQSNWAIIPEPEPDIITPVEEDTGASVGAGKTRSQASHPAGAGRAVRPAAADDPPIRRETWPNTNTVARSLARLDAGKGGGAIPTDGSRLVDALEHRTGSRWPVPIRGARGLPTR